MRSAILAAISGLALLLTGCTGPTQVTLGAHGATSPAESGQHGALADQRPDIKSDYEIKPIEQPITNDFTDPSMEGSGNIAAQGDYKEVASELQKKPSPPIE